MRKDGAADTRLLTDFATGLIAIEQSRAREIAPSVYEALSIQADSASAVPEEARFSEAVIAHEVGDGNGARIVGARFSRTAAGGIEFAEYFLDPFLGRWVLEDSDLHAQRIQRTQGQVSEVMDINPILLLWSRVALS